MNQEIIQLRDKSDEFSRLRVKSALALMKKDEADVFQSFPLLLHFNTPSMPGYIEGDVPTGICQFSPTKKHQLLAQQLFATELPDNEATHCEIIGLYAMGSTSSIGQCSESDFDVWICYSHTLDKKRVALLDKKAWEITYWAESLGVELNFFLIPDNKFRVNNQSELSNESCGTSQHMLLLDEFYRTSLRVAGRRILWRQIPHQHEKNYDEYVKELHQTGQINIDDWLDLGGLHRVPAEELFGATLWQLYKGIDNPYKATLKTILMEAYSWEYPNTELISTSYKKSFQEQDSYDEELDPYCLMLKKVSDYLISINDLQRLELVRVCFYFKTEEMISKPSCNDNSAWRRSILNKLIKEWGWTDNQIADLDNRNNWKIREVQQANDLLLDSLMLSYSNLIKFARDNNISESISAEDIGILSRKLYAAHETLPGKVDIINPNISPNLMENNLSLIQIPEHRKNKAGWYLFNSTLDTFELATTPCIGYSPYLSKLVAWSYVNGLYDEDTMLHLYNQGSDLVDKNLNQFGKDLYAVFPIYEPKASDKALSAPCAIKHLSIFLNVEKDPTRHWQDTEESELNQIDNVMAYGEHKESLIGSIDFIYRNSWNEVRTLHFNSQFSVVEALNTILSKMHQDASPPNQIDLFCYSRHFSEQICQSFGSKLNEFIQLRLHTVHTRSVQTLWTGGRKFGFYFERKGVSLQHLESAVDIYSHISKKKLSASTVNLKNTHFDQTANVIESHISEGLIQFFFENYSNGFNVYIANAENDIETFLNFAGSKNEFVQNVNRFYASNSHVSNQQDDQINFNLPQFYDITLNEDKTLSLNPFKSVTLTTSNEDLLSALSNQ
ncbi:MULTISPECIES: class I adenylate cyclase [Psychromonas]|uniref:class I adenylate cyclase n=2 Tax=Alteromonadales TaxID=135622 RepID=UPI000684A4C2|nr:MULTISPECIES: class I adenylate cyclase [Psychromonas]MBB1273124.1 class I adenylate cyclase [Psychromonas sp. SR45-3]